MSWDLHDLLQNQLEARRAAGQLRSSILVESTGPTHLKVNGRDCLNFASNNYLGLTHHPAIASAIAGALGGGAGAAAAPLITGHTTLHDQAEKALARWKSTQAALLLPSGYQAAHAVVQTLSTIPKIRFLIDKLSHASLIDAITRTGQDFRVFPHNNLEKLKRLLAQAPGDRPQVVVTESIFSMNGDRGDLAGLATLKQSYPFVLLVDEAHGSGVYGLDGAGLASELGLSGSVDISIVTLSKSLGLGGGAICCSHEMRQAIVNFGRAYIYSTAISPLIAAAVPAALEVLRTEPQRQQRVRELAARVRCELADARMQLPPGDSPIIPVILGDELLAMAAAQELREEGLFVLPIRPPTVPPGSSRLRITLSAAHREQEVEQLLRALKHIKQN